ncbi:MAG TPA: MlaD family protein [Candidatus Methanoperedens sp.]|nr:MlaD family protein [Candidatus Methanoperedens sp.]
MRESDPRFARLERRVGLFLLATVLIVAGAIGVVGVRQGLFTPKADVLLFDESGRDLVEGMEVVTRGFRIGKVRDVRLNDDGRVQVTLAIERRQLRWIRQDSVARVALKAFIGDSRIEVSPGTPQAPPLPAGGTITLVRDPDLTEIAKKVMEEVKPVLLAVKSLIEYLDNPEGDVKQSLANVNRISAGLVDTRERVDEALARVSARVDAIGGHLEALAATLRGEVLPQVAGLVGDGRQLLGETRQIAGDAGRTVRSLDAFVKEDLSRLTAALREEVIPQVRDLIAEADRAAAAAGTGVDRVNRELPAILEEVQASLENIRVITAQLVPASQEAAGVLRQGGELVEDSQALVRRAQELWPFRTGAKRTGTTVEVDSYEIEKRPGTRDAADPGGR